MLPLGHVYLIKSKERDIFWKLISKQTKKKLPLSALFWRNMNFQYWITASVTGLYPELEQGISQIQGCSLLSPFLYSYDYLYYDQNTMRGKSTLGVGGRMLLSAAILKILLCENSRSRSKYFLSNDAEQTHCFCCPEKFQLILILRLARATKWKYKVGFVHTWHVLFRPCIL